jgi:hypothetical protein
MEMQSTPQASEIDNSGIENTPYVIDANNVDQYPLVSPFDIEKNTMVNPTPTPTSISEPVQTVPILAVAVAGLVLAGFGLLVYFKKLRRSRSP